MKCVFARAALADALVPADDAAMKLVRRLKPGQHCMVEARRPRSLQHHRLLFALLAKVVDNLPGNHTPEQLLQVIKLRTGFVDVIRTRRGIVEIPKSIAFESMAQDEFTKFWDAAVAFICAEVLPVAPADLEREVQNMIADHRWEGAA